MKNFKITEILKELKRNKINVVSFTNGTDLSDSEITLNDTFYIQINTNGKYACLNEIVEWKKAKAYNGKMMKYPIINFHPNSKDIQSLIKRVKKYVG